jgi:lysine-N-methylase
MLCPNYAESFRCIGPACEDTCCQGWTVLIDRDTYEKYQTIPAGPLRSRIDDAIESAPEQKDGSPRGCVARIKTAPGCACPMLTTEKLCSIQLELGEAYLSHTCATYPRIVRPVGGIDEKALALSCPEAARLVLLNPRLMEMDRFEPHRPSFAERAASPMAADDPGEDAACLPEGFWPIRRAVLALVKNRAYPLWQRLFLLGVFCRRLDSIAAGELRRSIPEFLLDFEASVVSATLQTALDALPVDRAAQLDVVLRLAGMLLHRSNVRPRFAECINAFTRGIGNGPGATLESLTSHFALAHDRFFAPFFARQPYILENYLVNAIFRGQFPFGREGIKPGAAPSHTREFVQLAGQFALIKGLLIGVAGFHGEAFGAEHVVHTVQAASKHFEHHPEFLNQTYALLVESRMDEMRGLAILLRNDATRPMETQFPVQTPPRPESLSPLVPSP